MEVLRSIRKLITLPTLNILDILTTLYAVSMGAVQNHFREVTKMMNYEVGLRCNMTYPLNLLDLIFTLYALSLGIPEANPFVRNPVVMVVYKVVVIGGLCWWLNRRTETIAVVGRHLLTAVYAALNVWHIYNLFVR